MVYSGRYDAIVSPAYSPCGAWAAHVGHVGHVGYVGHSDFDGDGSWGHRGSCAVYGATWCIWAHVGSYGA